MPLLLMTVRCHCSPYCRDRPPHADYDVVAMLDQMAGRHLFFKCEQFQKVGAFQFRGRLTTP